MEIYRQGISEKHFDKIEHLLKSKNFPKIKGQIASLLSVDNVQCKTTRNDDKVSYQYSWNGVHQFTVERVEKVKRKKKAVQKVQVAPDRMNTVLFLIVVFGAMIIAALELIN